MTKDLLLVFVDEEGNITEEFFVIQLCLATCRGTLAVTTALINVSDDIVVDLKKISL